jgi:PAS domain S-box-containing protein
LIVWEMNARTRRFTRVSGRAEAVLGYPAERWSAVPGFWIGVLHPDDRERVAHAVWHALEQRSACEIEYRAVAADGSVVRLRDRVKVIPDPGGGDGLVLQGAITNVTAREAAPRAPASRLPRRWRRSRYAPPAGIATPARPLVDVEAAPVPFRAEPPPPLAFAPERLLDRAGEAIIASDSEHRIVYWNQAAEALLGVPAASALGMSDGELLRTRTSAGQTAEILAGLLGRRPWSAEVSIGNAHGEQIPVRITASALRDNGGVLGYVAVITDLREVRRGEAVRGAAAAMDAVARLARGVAVELNEGVARIEAAVRNALARVETGDPSRVELDDALRGVDATAALASQLLAVGRGLSVDPHRTDLRDVVRRGLPAIRLLAGDTVEIVTELDLSTPPAVVDPSVASQILLNLVANCVSAMPDGGRLTIATGVIEVTRNGAPGGSREVDPGQWIALDVRDTRDYEADNALERVFEPFSDRVSPPGMGLAAAHGLAVLSKGHLIASRTRSGGLSFRLFLPPAGRERT